MITSALPSTTTSGAIQVSYIGSANAPAGETHGDGVCELRRRLRLRHAEQLLVRLPDHRAHARNELLRHRHGERADAAVPPGNLGCSWARDRHDPAQCPRDPDACLWLGPGVSRGVIFDPDSGRARPDLHGHGMHQCSDDGRVRQWSRYARGQPHGACLRPWLAWLDLLRECRRECLVGVPRVRNFGRVRPPRSGQSGQPADRTVRRAFDDHRRGHRRHVHGFDRSAVARVLHRDDVRQPRHDGALHDAGRQSGHDPGHGTDPGHHLLRPGHRESAVRGLSAGLQPGLFWRRCDLAAHGSDWGRDRVRLDRWCRQRRIHRAAERESLADLHGEGVHKRGDDNGLFVQRELRTWC